MPPLTEEQFNKAREAGFTAEQIIEFEKQRLGDSQPQISQPKTGIKKVAENVTNYTLPQWLTEAEFQPNQYNLYGDISERPAAGVRSFLMGKGYGYGALNPQNIPTLSELAVQTYINKIGADKANPVLGTLIGMGGAGLDMATNPLNLLLLLAGKTPGGEKIGQEIGRSLGLAKNIVGKTVGKIAQSSIGQATKEGITKTKEGLSVIPHAIQTIKNIPDKFFRGGLTKAEALRVESEYGASNGSLVEIVKNKLNQAISYADDMYNKVFQKTPENKFINIRPSIEEAGRRLKRLGLITEKGNLTELGNSEISRDSVYGKLLDFYKSSNAISGVEKLQNKPLTQSQFLKAFRADRETYVNKDQYLFLRDKLNSLYKNKPSDIDVGKVVDSFYQAGEKSGLTGLQVARKLEREAFRQEGKFLNRNTGDLKIATEAKLNRIGTDKPLSRQEMQHILELQQYVKHPIIPDAAKINKLNRAKDIIKKTKERATWGGAGAITGGLITKKLLGR